MFVLLILCRLRIWTPPVKQVLLASRISRVRIFGYMANVGLGSEAEVTTRLVETSAIGGKADCQDHQMYSLLTSTLCQERTLAILVKDQQSELTS